MAETRNVGHPKSFITFREYTESQDKIKKDLLQAQDSIKKELTTRLEKAETQHDKLDVKINGIDDKVDQVKDIVLPLTIAMNNTADNTKQLVLSFEKFTESQMSYNGMFTERFHAQDIKITGIEHITNGFKAKKTYNLGVTAALIGLAGIFLGGLFNLAPYIFGN